MSLEHGEFLSNGEVVTMISDVSHWQDDNQTTKRPDFKQMREMGIRGVGIRVNENDNVDEDFEYNFKAAEDAGLYPFLYSFLEYRPGIMKPMETQAKVCMEEINRVRGSINGVRLFADYEKPNDQWPALPSYYTSIAYLSQWFGVSDPELGHLTGLYGNRATIFNITPVPTKTLQRDLWLAAWAVGQMLDVNYPTWLTWRPNYSPWSRENWKLWQTGFLNGIDLGMESKEVDADLWFGDVKSYIQWAGYDQEEIPQPQPSIDIKDEVHDLEIRLIEAREAVEDAETLLNLIKAKAGLGD